MATETPTSSGPYTEKFSAYFDREVSRKAAHSLNDGAEMEFHVVDFDEQGNPLPKPIEVFTFTKQNKHNKVLFGPAASPQLKFQITPRAAEVILADTSEEVGQIGVNILKLVVSPLKEQRVKVEFKAGFLTLFTKGYLGIVTAGGSSFSTFLASRGLNGMGAIKAALKKMKG